MSVLLSSFKAVSVTFACAAVATGGIALLNPARFSHSFGIPVKGYSTKTAASSTRSRSAKDAALDYVSLMGVRQLATGITLLTFAYQGKWTEIATIASILGFVVAGTDGVHLARAGNWAQARFHAIPGAAIALLAVATLAQSD